MHTHRKIRVAILLPIAAILFLIANVKTSAVSEYDSDSNVAFGLIGTAGTGATYDLSLSDIPVLGPLFDTSPEDYGQNMYEVIHERIKSRGTDIAISRTLARRPLSKEELLTIIPGSNIGYLLKEENPDENLSPGEVNTRLAEFERDLAEEKVLADLFVETKMATEPTEIFANGDESDSGFDLLADLDIIDQILFGRTESVFGGGGPGSPPGGAVIGAGGGAGGVGSPVGAGGVGSSVGAGGALLDDGGDGAGNGAGVPRGPAGGAGGSEPSAEEDAVLCPINADFNGSIVALRADERAEEERNDGGAGGGGAGAESGGGAGGAGGAGGGGGGAGGLGDDEVDADRPVVPEEAGDWTRPRICTTRFCLRLEAKYKTESAYLANANCIACHFEKINDSFKETLDHNLVPSKATGNLFEGPKCKRSLFGLKFNFILIPQPIMTPPNDDIIVKGDFIKNSIDFYEKYFDNPDRCKDGVCKADPDPEVESTRIVLEQAGDDSNISDKLRNIRTQVASKKAEAAAIMKKSRMDSDSENQASQYRVLMQEIDSFNSYFRSFVTLYDTIVSDDPEFPCEMLLNKETCS